MKKFLFRHREAITYCGVLIVAALICAPIVSSVVRSTLSPTITANAKAYVTLVESLTCGRYDDAKRLADSAYTTADDPDIRKLADYVSRMAQMTLRTGVQTRDEAQSFTGLAKAFVTGFKNPLSGIVDGLGLSIETMFGHWKETGNRLIRSQLHKTLGYYRYRSQVGTWLRPRIQRLPVVGTTPKETQPTV